MDVLSITDIDKLKVMAYDQLVLLQQVQRNLEIINTRIAELQQALKLAGTPQQPHAHTGQKPATEQPFTGRSHY